MESVCGDDIDFQVYSRYISRGIVYPPIRRASAHIHIVVGKERFPSLAQSVQAAGDKLSISVNLMTHVDGKNGSGSRDHDDGDHDDDGEGMVTVG